MSDWVVLAAAVAWAADAPRRESALAKARRVESAITAQGILEGRTLRWLGVDYALRSPFELCPGSGDLCYLVRGPTDAMDSVAAVTETKDGVGVALLDVQAYDKARSERAAEWFARRGVGPEQLGLVVDRAGRPAFDSWKRLTPDGHALYEAVLRGGEPVWRLLGQADLDAAAAADAQARGVRWGDPEQAERKVKELTVRGWFEVDAAQLKCLREWYFTDEELQLREVPSRRLVRTFIQHDPTGTSRLVLGRLEETKKCRTGGMVIRRRGASE